MFLLDTDIIIYSFKNDNNVIANLTSHKHDPKAISVVTYGELIYGAQKSKNRINNLAKVHSLKEIFPIIDITPSIMLTFGEIKASLEKRGKSIDDFDLLIAATAITSGYTLVTNNTKHFERINNLTITNWHIF